MVSVMLYFGSFNPVHNGHMAIAGHVLLNNIACELWFVVSPRNPLKPQGILIDEHDRLEMVRIAIAGSEFSGRMKACDVEFRMPKPSYTIDTLSVLENEYPENEFSLLVGSDIMPEFEKWKEWRKLLDNYKIYVYPRRGYSENDIPVSLKSRVIVLEGAPFYDYSSTEIRNAIVHGTPVESMIPPAVGIYIKTHSLWTMK